MSETVALHQMTRPREVQEIGLARIGDETDAPAVPIEIGEGHGVDRGSFRPIPSRPDRNRAAHQ